MKKFVPLILNIKEEKESRNSYLGNRKSNTSEPHKGPSTLLNPDSITNSKYLHDSNLPRPIIDCFDPLYDGLWKNSKHESHRERKDLSEKVRLPKNRLITNRELYKTFADSESKEWTGSG